MKIDLDATSKRLCSAGLLALFIQQVFPDYAPAWLGGYFAIALIAGLGFMLAHEIRARRQREQAIKPTVLAH